MLRMPCIMMTAVIAVPQACVAQRGLAPWGPGYRRLGGLQTARDAAYLRRTSSTIAFAAFVAFVALTAAAAPPPFALFSLLLIKLQPAISAQPPPGLSKRASALPPPLLLLGSLEAGGGGTTATAAAISRHLSCTVALNV
jgi:hypothetical protein